MTTTPFTLRSVAGLETSPPSVRDAVIVVIDAQATYATEPLLLHQVDNAVANIARILRAARGEGAPIIHVVHAGAAGDLFDPAVGGRIIDSLEPVGDEVVVTKTLPNSFAGTDLDQILSDSGRKRVVLVGFMTHMCVSATARSATDHGYDTTVISDACTSRSLPSAVGGAPVAAQVVHETALAELADRFSVIATTDELLDVCS